MAVTEGKLPVGDTGLDLDTTVVEQTDGADAHREVVVIGDPEALGAYADVKSVLRGGTGYAAQMNDPVAVSHLETISDMLDKLLTQQKLTNELLKGILQ